MATRYFVFYLDYITNNWRRSNSGRNVGFFDVEDADKLMRIIARRCPLVQFRIQSNIGDWTSLPFAYLKKPVPKDFVRKGIAKR